MKALLKIEWIKTWRSWPIFILGIGMPVAFYLLYSSIVSSPTPELQKEFLKTYMLTMTGFSMSSFGLFTFPYMLQEDQTEHWLTYIEHSKISIWAYYLSKIFRVLLNFIVAIIVTFWSLFPKCRDAAFHLDWFRCSLTSFKSGLSSLWFTDCSD